jgi:RNA polymerase sigma-70 factor (ECF subfamily)
MRHGPMKRHPGSPPPPSDGSPSDLGTLVAQIRTGSTSAFEELFTAFAAALANFVFRYVESQDDAQEIVQDLFFTLWRDRERLIVTGSIHDYLYAAARNRARDWLKHRRVMHRWQERAVHEIDIVETEDAVDQQLIRAEERAAIERALAELPERRRAICTLRWTSGLSYAEIAQRLGISEKTVETQLNRAVRELRQRLHE